MSQSPEDKAIVNWKGALTFATYQDLTKRLSAIRTSVVELGLEREYADQLVRGITLRMAKYEADDLLSEPEVWEVEKLEVDDDGNTIAHHEGFYWGEERATGRSALLNSSYDGQPPSDEQVMWHGRKWWKATKLEIEGSPVAG